MQGDEEPEVQVFLDEGQASSFGDHTPTLLGQVVVRHDGFSEAPGDTQPVVQVCDVSHSADKRKWAGVSSFIPPPHQVETQLPCSLVQQGSSVESKQRTDPSLLKVVA